MNFAYTATITSLLLFGPAKVGAALFSADFESPDYNSSVELAGQQGWTINSSIPNISHFASVNASTAGLLGGTFAGPEIANIALNHAYSASAGGTSFDVDFRINPSTPSFPQRDSFGWSFKASGPGDLFRVAFEPGVPGQLQVLWYDNVNVGHTLPPAGQDIFYGGAPYHLNVGFTDAGADLNFTATITGSNAVSWSGTLAGAGGANLTSFAAVWNLNGPIVDAGDNFMTFDGLTIVPEPSASLLSVALATGLMLRRKRA